MKPRDIITNQITHRETDTVPYTLGWEGDIGERLDAYYGNDSWRLRIKRFTKSMGVVETMKRRKTENEGYELDPFGSLWRVNRRPFHLEKPGMERPSFQGYRWPSPEEFFASEEAIKEAQKTYDEAKDDYFLIAYLGWGLFETGWGVRGFENVMMDMVAEPAFYEDLLDKITEQFFAYLEFTCEHLPDVDGIMFGDDWGHQRGVMAGPDRWRELFKPRYKKIYDMVHKKGKYIISHCCGSVVDIMPDIIEIGLDVLESVQPEARGMNPYELKASYGDDIAFWGCLGSQSTIPFGTPAEITSEVKKLKQRMGAGGGFILAPAKSLQPGTPIANAAAVVEAFTDED